MTTLLTLTFQGEPRAVGPLSTVDEREAARAAFPLTPPRDASVRDGYRAFKMAPLASGRMLISAIGNRGDVDNYERPVLRATACLFEPGELVGPYRDPSAIWQVLAECDIDEGVAAFEGRVTERSVHSTAAVFEGFLEKLGGSRDFYARLAAVLGEDRVDLYLGDATDVPELLRPAFGLLPLTRLHSLNLAVGGESADLREAVLGLAEHAPESVRKKRGLLSGLFGKGDAPEGVAVDFGSEDVFGSREDGPVALVDALLDTQPWPMALPGIDRYRVLLESLDAGRSLFELLPELEELRQTVKRFEELSKNLKRLR